MNETLFIIGSRQANISHHLKVLSESGLLSYKKEGAEVYYRLNFSPVIPVLQSLFDLLWASSEFVNSQEDAGRMKLLLERREKKAKEYFESVGNDYVDREAVLYESFYTIGEAAGFFEKKVETILELGCGTGRNLPVLSRYAEKVMGLDASPKMIQLAEHICKTHELDYRLFLSDLYDVPLEDASVDGVFINMVLHHLSNPAQALKECSRILKPGGKAVIADLVSHQDETLRDRFADSWLGFEPSDIEEWLTENQFQIIKKVIKTNQGVQTSLNGVLMISAQKKSESSGQNI